MKIAPERREIRRFLRSGNRQQGGQVMTVSRIEWIVVAKHGGDQTKFNDGATISRYFRGYGLGDRFKLRIDSIR
jgi:hypothetical protein